MSLQEKIDTLLDVSRMLARCEEMLRHITAQQLQGCEDAEAYTDVERGIQAVLSSLASESHKIYTSLYSESEIDALIDLHKSPLGQKILNNEGLVRARIEAAMSAAIAEALS